MQNSNNNSQGGNRSKRGLASADRETRERVAREGGRASGEARRENSGRNSSDSRQGGRSGNR